jgi:hypothetical protein
MNKDPQVVSDLAPSSPPADGSSSDTDTTTGPFDQKNWIWAAVGIAAVIVAAIVAFGLAGDSDTDGADPVARQEFPAEAVGEEALTAVAAMASQNVYWIGPEDGMKYRISWRPDNGIQVDYLPEASGSPAPLVGSYPVPDAFAVTQSIKQQSGDTKEELPGGGVVTMSKDRPTNVYLAFPGADYQIEIFHPEPGVALELARSGRVIQLG